LEFKYILDGIIMELDTLSHQLTEKINSLQVELEIYKKQKEVISILEVLNSIQNLNLGYTGLANLEISKEGMADFISLLESN